MVKVNVPVKFSVFYSENSSIIGPINNLSKKGLTLQKSVRQKSLNSNEAKEHL
jgi:hypothetical protein